MTYKVKIWSTLLMKGTSDFHVNKLHHASDESITRLTLKIGDPLWVSWADTYQSAGPVLGLLKGTRSWLVSMNYGKHCLCNIDFFHGHTIDAVLSYPVPRFNVQRSTFNCHLFRSKSASNYALLLAMLRSRIIVGCHPVGYNILLCCRLSLTCHLECGGLPSCLYVL